MHSRINSIKIGLTIIALITMGRLFYWQVLSSDKLATLAESQRESVRMVPADRGEILTSDGYALVTNQPVYTVFAYIPQLTAPIQVISQQLAPILLDTNNLDATESAKPVLVRLKEAQTSLLTKLAPSGDQTWVPLKRRIAKDTKTAIEALNIEGIGFDPDTTRFYPEASISAQLLGFVGRDDVGDPQGYFGLEGFYNLELTGRPGMVMEEKDAVGRPIIIGAYQQTPGRPGRSLKLHLNRSLQHEVELALKDGIEKYGAKSGEVVIMDPFTGAILAMAALPSYDPATFNQFDQELYKNPSIASAYEPGSTFKTVIMAAAVNEAKITPDTICDSTCDRPVTIGKYTIRTWNDKYYPGQTMRQVLERSDNTGMIFIARRLGSDKLQEYLDKFGFGHLTGIDLQEEVSAPLRTKWGDIDVATASFGQGLAVTSIQMVRAVAAIANGGHLVTPQVVDQVEGAKTINIKPDLGPQVISPETSKTVTDMMVSSAEHGDAHWAIPKGYTVAGKTGTAQIPVQGHYDAAKTIASFIGFAPAEHPKFVMLVKLTEPTTSPWGSETAAPLWFHIASSALLLLK